MTEEQKNNTENCDQFTKPEEISALKKYLRALKEELDERTELGTESQMMDPSYREEKAHLDTSRENLTIGENPLLNLPGTKETIDVEKLSRLDQMRVRLEGNFDNLESLNNSLDKIQFISENESLSDELIKISGNKESVSLSNEVEKMAGDGKGSQELSNTVEKLNVEDNSNSLSDTVEKLTGIEGSDSLSNSVEKLKITGEESVLSNEVDRLSGEEKEIVLTDELDKIEGKTGDVSLSGELDKIKNSPNEVKLDNSREDIKGDKKENSLDSTLERIHDPFKKPEKLNDSVDTVDVKPSGTVDLSSYIDKIINPEEKGSVELSKDLEEVSGGSETYIDSLPENKEFIENPPKEQSLGRRILNKIRGVEKIDKLNGNKEIVRGTIQHSVELGSSLESPMNFTQENGEIDDLSDVVDSIDIPDKGVSLGEERQEIPFRGRTGDDKVNETLPRYVETINTNKEPSLKEDKEIIPGVENQELNLGKELVKESSLGEINSPELNNILDKSEKLSDAGINELDKTLDQVTPKVNSDINLNSHVEKVSGNLQELGLDDSPADSPKGDKKLDLKLGGERVSPAASNIEVNLGDSVENLDISNKGIEKLSTTLDKVKNTDLRDNSLETTLDKIKNTNQEDISLGTVLDKINTDQEDISLDTVLDKINTDQEDISLDTTLDKINTDQENISLDKVLEKISNVDQEGISLGTDLDKIIVDQEDVTLGTTLDKVKNTDQKSTSLDSYIEKPKIDLKETALDNTLEKIVTSEKDHSVSLPTDLPEEEKLKILDENSLGLSQELDKISVEEKDFNLSDYVDPLIKSSDDQVDLNRELTKDGISAEDQSYSDKKLELQRGLLESSLQSPGGYPIEDQERLTSQKIFYTREGLRYELQKDGYLIFDQKTGTEEKIYYSDNGLRSKLPSNDSPIEDQNSLVEEKIFFTSEGLRYELQDDGYLVFDQNTETEEKIFFEEEGLSNLISSDGRLLEDQNSLADEKVFFFVEGKLRRELTPQGKPIKDQNTGKNPEFEKGLRKELTSDGKVIKDQSPSELKTKFYKENRLAEDLSDDGFTISDLINSIEKAYLLNKGLRSTLNNDGRSEKDQLQTQEKRQIFKEGHLDSSLEKSGKISADDRPKTDAGKFINYDETELKKKGLSSSLTKQGKVRKNQEVTSEKIELDEEGLSKTLPGMGKRRRDQDESDEKDKLSSGQLNEVLHSDGLVEEDQGHTPEKDYLNYEGEMHEGGLQKNLPDNGLLSDVEEVSSLGNELTSLLGDQNSNTPEKEFLNDTDEFRDKGLRKEIFPDGTIIQDQNPNTPEKEYLNYEGRYHDKGLRKDIVSGGKIIKDQNPDTDEKRNLYDENWGEGLKNKLELDGHTIPDQNSKTPEKGELYREGLEGELGVHGISIEDQNPDTKQKIFFERQGLKEELDLDGTLIEDQTSDYDLKNKIKSGELDSELGLLGKLTKDQELNTEQKHFMEERGLQSELTNDTLLSEDRSDFYESRDLLESGKLADRLALDGRLAEDKNLSGSKKKLEKDKLDAELPIDGRVIEDQSGSDKKDELNSNRLIDFLELDGKIVEDTNDSEIKEKLNSDNLVDFLESEGKIIEDRLSSEIKQNLNSNKLVDSLTSGELVGEDFATSPIKTDLIRGILRDYLDSMGLVPDTVGPPKPNIEQLAIILEKFARNSKEFSDEQLRVLFNDLLYNKAEREKEYTIGDQTISSIKDDLEKGRIRDSLDFDGFTIEDQVGSPIKKDLASGILRKYLGEDGYIIEDQTTSEIKEDLNSDILRKNLDKDGISRRTTGTDKSGISQLAVVFDSLIRGDYGELSEQALKSMFDFFINLRAKVNTEKIREDQTTSDIKKDLESDILRNTLEIDGRTVRTVTDDLITDSDAVEIQQWAQFFDDLARDFTGKSLSEEALGALGEQFFQWIKRRRQKISNDRLDSSIKNDLDIGILRQYLAEDGIIAELEQSSHPSTAQLAIILDKLARGEQGVLSDDDLKGIYDFFLYFRAKIDREKVRDDQVRLNIDGSIGRQFDPDTEDLPDAVLSVRQGEVYDNDGNLLDDPDKVQYLHKNLEEDGHVEDDQDRTAEKRRLDWLLNSKPSYNATDNPDDYNVAYGHDSYRIAADSIEGIPEFVGTQTTQADNFAKELHDSKKHPFSEEEEEILRSALEARAQHDFQSYATYLINFANSKRLQLGDLGWTEKLSSILSNLSGKDVNASTIKWVENEIKNAAKEYYGSDKGRITTGYSDFPRSIEAMINANSYIRYLADQIRRGYNNLETEGGKFWGVLDGITGLKESTADKVFFLLLKWRDKLEVQYKAQPYRLPGNGTAFSNSFGKGLDGLLLDFAGGWANNVESITNSLGGDVGILNYEADEYDAENPDDYGTHVKYPDKTRGVVKPDRSKPLNRPEGDVYTTEKGREYTKYRRLKDEGAVTEAGIEDGTFIQNEKGDWMYASGTKKGKDITYKSGHKTWRDAEGWINPNEALYSEIDNPSQLIDYAETTMPIYDVDDEGNPYLDDEGNLATTGDEIDVAVANSIDWSGVNRRALQETLTGKGGAKQLPNYLFNREYMLGQGMFTTLHDLTNLDPSKVLTPRDLQVGIAMSPFMNHPAKFTKTRSLVSQDGKDTWADTNSPWTLDTDAYWEVVIEPYLGRDNGFRSYLPSVEEINAINWIQHNVVTAFDRWFPVVSFDLAKTKLTSKSLGIYGGEINFPGGVEFTNELRLTLVDNCYKSFRKYFEKCMNVSVFNSEIHTPEFYGYDSETGIYKGPRETMKELYLTKDNVGVDPYGGGGMYDLPGVAAFVPDERTGEKRFFASISNTVASAMTSRGLPSNYFITAVDKTSICLALYKNVTFRIRIYVMTPQYGTIDKYDLLCVLKDMSEERKGEIESGGSDLELQFSVVGENPNPLWGSKNNQVETKKEAPFYPEPKKEDKKPDSKPSKPKSKGRGRGNGNKNKNKNNRATPRTGSSKPSNQPTNNYATQSNRPGTGTGGINNNAGSSHAQPHIGGRSS